jgi:hypothetical protein
MSPTWEQRFYQPAGAHHSLYFAAGSYPGDAALASRTGRTCTLPSWPGG